MKRCIITIGAVAISALSAAAQEWPRYETSLDYTFTRFGTATNAAPFNANGGNGQFAYNFNRWLSGVIDAGAVHNANFRDTTVANYLGGPRITVRRSRLAPYFQVLFGGAYTTMSQAAVFATPLDTGGIFVTPGGTSVRVTKQANAFALAAGGGLDIKLNRHVSLRAFEVEYFMTRLPDFRAVNDNTQESLRASAGLSFTFGGEAPTPAPSAPHTTTCPDGTVVLAGEACPKHNLHLSLSATRELCQGETTAVNVSLSGAGNSPLVFYWSVDGQAVSQGHSFSFSTANRQPGSHVIALTVNGAGFNPASAQTEVVVREYRAPSATVKADAQEIYAGEKSTLTASCEGQCGGNIGMPTLAASEGTINGNEFDSTGVTFDPNETGEQRKTVTITASCADSRNTGTGTTTITVIKKATAAAIRLPDVLFDANKDRVNNCGKRILLEQLKSYFEREPKGTVALVGHNSSEEKAANLAEKRAWNAAAVVTAGKGVCLATPPSQVLVSSPGADQNDVDYQPGFCRSSVKGVSGMVEQQRVEVWFIPPDAQKPPSLGDYKDASALPIAQIGCPR